MKTLIVLEFIIIGDGVEKVELEKLVSNLSLKSVVEFKGALYNKDVEDYFRSSDFLLSRKFVLS